MEGTNYHLDETISYLGGATPEQIVVFNQWAATALDIFHNNSKANFVFVIDGNQVNGTLSWNSNFSKAAMRERKKIAEEGGVSLAFFVMSVLNNYKYLQQSEIGEGVDYGFQKLAPSDENFMQGCHYVEISALLKENGTNTLINRIQIKHAQIRKGNRRSEPSSVIVTLFNTPTTVKEIHL